MDVSPIIGQVFSALWYLVPLMFLLAIIKSPWFKGLVGEFVVNTSAKLFLRKDQYHLIKNVTLAIDGGTTQIDHVIVSIFGVFVVETKNMKGWIFGDPHQKTWTQKIYKYTTKFQNPLHQNYKHVKAVEALLGLDEQQMHSLVVFVGNCAFKTLMPENVTYAGGYVKYIKSKNVPCLTELEVKEITDKLERSRLARSFSTNRAHVAHVRNIVAKKENNNVTSCPQCGGLMLLRETNKGPNVGKKFWGCAQFPRCRGIVKSL